MDLLLLQKTLKHHVDIITFFFCECHYQVLKPPCSQFHISSVDTKPVHSSRLLSQEFRSAQSAVPLYLPHRICWKMLNLCLPIMCCKKLIFLQCSVNPHLECFNAVLRVCFDGPCFKTIQKH